MGLFGRKLIKEKKDAVIDWLEQVDLAYQRAFQVKNASGMAEFFTRSCLMKTMEKIRMGEKAYAGLARYQNVSWIKGEVTPDEMQYIKKVSYDNINMSHGIVIPVGDEAREVWVIVTENGKNKISEIRRCHV